MSLPISTIGVAVARAASLALSFVPGQTKLAGIFTAIADGMQAGLNVDRHMADVTAKLKAGPVTDSDWDEVKARIEADSARLQKA